MSILCTRCGYVGNPLRITKGSFVMELCLWLIFLLPGLIYSIWRFSSKEDICPNCHNPDIISASSPVAQKYLSEQLQQKLSAAMRDIDKKNLHSKVVILLKGGYEKKQEIIAHGELMVGPLTKALKDDDWLVRREAAWVLDQIKDGREKALK